MEMMAGLLRQGRPAAEVMQWIFAQDAERDLKEGCPCGSGFKFGYCHGHTTYAMWGIAATVFYG
jgi:uncharacterized protein